jgi:peptide/nickel transport system substrate-binding protein
MNRSRGNRHVLASLMALFVVLSLTGARRAAPAPAAQPRAGGTATISITTDPVMNPVLALGVSAYWVSAILFDALTKPDEKGRPVPNLAERWTVSQDGKTYTFFLRKDVRWHDGRPFTAEDVKFTIDLIKDPKTNTTLRGNYQPVDQVVVVDQHTVQFRLSRPYTTLLSWLYWYAGIVPKHLLQGRDVNTYNEFNKQRPIGTGPFKLKEYRAGEYLLLERYDAYHGGRPLLDQVAIRIIPNTNTAVAQMRAGTLDFLSVPPQVLAGVRGDPNIDILFFNLPRYDFIAPNQNLRMFQDKRVRQALAYGLNRQAIMQVATEGYALMSAGPIPPNSEFYNKKLRPYPYDPERAKGLLREAGWADTDNDGVLERDLGDGRRTPLRFRMTYFGGVPQWEGQAAIAKEDYRALGADVVLDPVEQAQLQFARVVPRAYDTIISAWITLDDPDVLNYFHSSTAMAGANYGIWRNPEADRLLEQGQAEGNIARRKDIYAKFQELVRDEEPVIFTFHPREINLKTKRLQGVLPSHFRVNIYWLHKWWVRQ